MRLDEIAALAGVEFFDYQLETFESAEALSPSERRLCLYYRTGAGKSLTSLTLGLRWGHSEAVVIAPPSTHSAWMGQAERLGMSVTCMSHAMFRLAKTKLSRDTMVIADEFHLFGGHTGQGWKKLDRLARGLRAPIILASATPNYNDAERVYCIQHVLDPESLKGGYLEFLYQNCDTRQNQFKREPDVLGFKNYPEAKDYLNDLKGVHYLPDNVAYTIQDHKAYPVAPLGFDEYGYDSRSHRIMASQIEERHRRIYIELVSEQGFLKQKHYKWLEGLVSQAKTPTLIFSAHATVAQAVGRSLTLNKVKFGLVTGSLSTKKKDEIITAFARGELDVLVGTASLATGTDGLDKVCDNLVILDDTEDDSLRRQLIGRIMPRGVSVDASKKQVHRLLLL